MVIIKKVILIPILLLIFSLSQSDDKTNTDIKNNLDLTVQEYYLIPEEVALLPQKSTLKVSTSTTAYSENKIYNDLSSNGGRVQLYENEFGTKLDGYDYDVILPDGVPTVVAPDVVGMSIEDASTWSLLNLNRNITIFGSECFDSNLTPGTIIRQSPLPGSLIPNDYNVLTTNSITTGLTVWTQSENCEELVSE